MATIIQRIMSNIVEVDEGEDIEDEESVLSSTIKEQEVEKMQTEEGEGVKRRKTKGEDFHEGEKAKREEALMRQRWWRWMKGLGSLVENEVVVIKKDAEQEAQKDVEKDAGQDTKDGPNNDAKQKIVEEEASTPKRTKKTPKKSSFSYPFFMIFSPKKTPKPPKSPKP